ncbi:F-box domain-containing protein [Aspergillus fumigatus Z5]|nr:F-box domain-containing protein [Aspergillus fumigatus Z5]
MTGLAQCPAQVVEEIVAYLDLTDVGNLRQTNRRLRSQVTQGRFRLNFRSKRVKITGADLQQLGLLTQRGWLGCETRHLTLVGVVNDTMALEAGLKADATNPRKRDLAILQQRRQDYEQLLESGKIVQLLSQAFKYLATNSAERKLQSLSLEVTVYRQDAEREVTPLAGSSWRLVWQTTAETFRIVLAALQKSLLAVDYLNVFNGSYMQRCSLESRELSQIDYHNERLSKVLGALKALSLSVSDRILWLTPQDAQRSSDGSADVIDWSDDEHDRRIDKAAAETQDENNFVGLARILDLCHELKSLQIHQYLVNARHLTFHIPFPRERLFQRVAELAALPALEDCSLRGVFIRERDLLALLKRTQLRRLTLESVQMVSGDLVHFTGVGAPRFNTWVGAHGSNTLKREGEALKHPIRYHLPHGMPIPLGSPARQQWILEQRQEYGPHR